MKTNAELIKWLRDNSSGVYRPSAEGAERLELALYLLRHIIHDLPARRDWLNPEIERAAKDLLFAGMDAAGTHDAIKAAALVEAKEGGK